MDTPLTVDAFTIYHNNVATFNKQPQATFVRLIGLPFSSDFSYCLTVLFACDMTSESPLAPK